MLPSPPSSLFAGGNLSRLLGRPLRDIPVLAGQEQLTGARVLVTGAGGSVGASLLAALAGLQPARVIALDLHEPSLFRLGRDAPRDLPLDLQLADVRNASKISRIFAESQPDIVVHLAAYKHVPMGEASPDEPVSVNVLGSDALVQAAIAAGVRHFVYPSSDKAVNPPSVYGATKRLAETLLHRHARAQSTTAIHIVRFVNIIGTSGSVIETFVTQAQAGRPLTVTDGRMTRYWMAMDEAVGLSWHALGLPNGSHTVLDVGEPVLVRNLAATVAEIVRQDKTPPDIEEMGTRPGERLFEELASANERLTRCGDEPVWHIGRVQESKGVSAEDLTREVRALLDQDDLDLLRARIMQLSEALQ
jgi:FlaA1/EpsC-like NDP-sugar epimerase